MDSVFLVILFAAFGLLFHQTPVADARSCICQPIQKPVCGYDGVIYTNPCQALCAGTEVHNFGKCDQPVVRSVTYKRPNFRRPVFNDLLSELRSSAPNDEPDPPPQRWHLGLRCSTCESSERLVCGDDGRTYANADCALKCGGVSVAYEGQCRPRLGASRYRPACDCPTISWPVCGIDGATYSNPCRALCRNVAVASDGPCELQAIQLIRRRILGRSKRRR